MVSCLFNNKVIKLAKCIVVAFFPMDSEINFLGGYFGHECILTGKIGVFSQNLIMLTMNRIKNMLKVSIKNSMEVLF